METQVKPNQKPKTKYAALPIRLAASMLDAALSLCSAWGICAALGLLVGKQPEASWFFLGFIFTYWVYSTLSLSSLSRATFFQRLFQLRVLRSKGLPLSLSRASARQSLVLLSFLSAGLICFFKRTPKKGMWTHDVIVDSVVIMKMNSSKDRLDRSSKIIFCCLLILTLPLIFDFGARVVKTFSATTPAGGLTVIYEKLKTPATSKGSSGADVLAGLTAAKYLHRYIQETMDSTGRHPKDLPPKLQNLINEHPGARIRYNPDNGSYSVVLLKHGQKAAVTLTPARARNGKIEWFCGHYGLPEKDLPETCQADK